MKSFFFLYALKIYYNVYGFLFCFFLHSAEAQHNCKNVGLFAGTKHKLLLQTD